MNGFETAALLGVCLTFVIARWRRRQRPTVALPQSHKNRLARIKDVSWWIQALICLNFVVGFVYWTLAFFFGWSFLGQGNVKIALAPNYVYSSASEMPQAILAWWLVKITLSLICNALLFSLFGLYQKGILFSAKNIRHIHGLAYYLIATWIVDYQIQSTLSSMALSTGPLFMGFVIIFIAWIMDEGRKIQEEQELTV